MSQISGTQIYLKMENTHPAGSFKMRGLSLRCQKGTEEGYSDFVIASGGSAGLAVAHSARTLGVRATIVVPKTTSKEVGDRIRALGAQLLIHGDCFQHANEYAIKIAKERKLLFIHPFDDPLIWEGHGTMIEECAEYLKEKPSAIVVSVGGGGLACGVIHGMEKVGWSDVPLIAVETKGADCFNLSVKAKEKIVLSEITSVAICLGSLCVCDQLLKHLDNYSILSEVVEDKDAVMACLRFADDHRTLVDPACGAALSLAYSGRLKEMMRNREISNGYNGYILFIVCGGNDVNLAKLENWKRQFDL